MKIALSIFFTLILGVSLLSCSSKTDLTKAGTQSPLTRFTFLNGGSVSSDHYQGKYLLLYFWATTCGKSRGNLDELSDYMREAVNARHLKVVAVNVDKFSKEDEVRKFISSLKKSNIEYAYSGNDIYDEAYMAYDVGELPTVILIDPEGLIVEASDSLGPLYKFDEIISSNSN